MLQKQREIRDKFQSVCDYIASIKVYIYPDEAAGTSTLGDHLMETAFLS